MKRLSKSERETLRNKFGGRCAYCGNPLPALWHADHLKPVERKLANIKGKGFVATGELYRPENDNMENLMPACPPCNISKHSMNLEAWRKWIAGHVASLNSYHPIYSMAKAYGLIYETGAAVIFYFESVEANSAKDQL